MLYRPMRGELDPDEVMELYLEEHEGKLKVDIVKSQVMEHLDETEMARHYVTEVQKQIDLEETEAALDAQGLQDNEDCDEEGPELHPDFQHCQQEVGEFGDNDSCRDKPDYQATLPSRIDMPTDEELKESIRGLDPFQREVVNLVIKHSRDIVKSRKTHNPYPTAPLLMVHGGAGAGKSKTINVSAMCIEKTLRQAGDNSEQPLVLKTAFTGTAAANIKGQTLSSVFSLPFNDSPNTLGDKTREMKRVKYGGLTWLIIDEISFVKSDQFHIIYLRLQDYTQKHNIPFGGVGILCFGDLMQLRPVNGKFIYEPPSPKSDFGEAAKWAPLWSRFDSLILERNHRQGADGAYADLLNLIRVGAHTDADLEPLRERVRPHDHPDLEDVRIWISGLVETCDKINEKFVGKMPGEMIVLRAIHSHATLKNFKPPMRDKDGTVGQTGLKDVLNLKRGAKVMVIDNIDVSDGITNGTFGEFVDVVVTKSGQVDKLVVRPDDSSTGNINRTKFPQLAHRFPDCIFVEKVSKNYTLNQKRRGDVASRATVIQFPVRLSFATTTHKMQGATIVYPNKVVLDINSCFGPAMAYVMLSRVQSIDQLYILDSLDPKAIKVEEGSIKELERLDSISYNRNPTPWNAGDQVGIRIASLNIAGLNAHHRDLRADEKLLKASVLMLSETSLIPGSSNCDQYQLPGFEASFGVVGNGKGVACYHRVPGKQCNIYSQADFQIMELIMDRLDIISLYRSSSASIVQVVESLEQRIRWNRPTIITGDFNLCFKTNSNNGVTKRLLELGFTQLVKEATHIQGGHIDHVYWRDQVSPVFQEPVLERYSPYYSDHDALLVTLKLQTPSPQ